MQIASVMAVADGCTDTRAVIDCAISTGRALNAVTALVHISPSTSNIIYPASEFASSRLVEKLISELEHKVSAQRTEFDDIYQQCVLTPGLPTIAPEQLPNTRSFAVTKLQVTGHENREIARRGRLFDLIIVGPPHEDSGGVDNAALEAALLDTGRPVLIAPSTPCAIAGCNITICWDGSREAAMSVRNALPLLSNANHIEVVYAANSDNDEVDPQDITKYLHLHGIDAKPRRIPMLKRRASEVLLDAASENDNAILVMGAYGQSAMSEFMFGGVTRDVMGATKSPLFLSH